jgi:hypothetical protein
VPGALQSPRGSLSIVRGCDGAGVAFPLIAAILAFSAGAKRKLIGVGVGCYRSRPVFCALRRQRRLVGILQGAGLSLSSARSQS